MAGPPTSRSPLALFAPLAPAAWLVGVVAVAIAGATLVAVLNPPLSPGARPELTSVADRAAARAMDATLARLRAAADDVTALEATARTALAQALGADAPALQATLAAGPGHLTSAMDDVRAFETAASAVPGMGPGRETRLSAPILARFDALAAARGRDLARGLDLDWTTFALRAGNAVDLVTLLQRHDTETAAAAALGKAARYQDAVAALDAPDASLALARRLREALSATTDVGTLTIWLDANAAYDAALRSLYRALLASGGTVDDAVRAAAAAEQAARAGLPPDSRGLTLILSDIARGGLNQAILAIAATHDAMAAVLDEQARLTPPG